MIGHTTLTVVTTSLSECLRRVTSRQGREPNTQRSMRQVGMLFILLACILLTPAAVQAGSLTVQLDQGESVTFVGAIRRWDVDGNPRKPVDPKAKIDAPSVDAVAERHSSGTWGFSQLESGSYDLVLLVGERTRIEGFTYPPVLEFDPFFTHDQRPAEKVITWIRNDIAQSRHYENKVEPLFFAGDDKHVRVLVQLLRDQPTSYDGQYGQQVATLRHEIWQYDQLYGAWSKNKRTRVLDRILMGKKDLRRWTWVWDPRLGGIQVSDRPVRVTYPIADDWTHSGARGLLPY